MGDENEPKPAEKPQQTASADEQGLDDVRGRLDALEQKLEAHRVDPSEEAAAKSERSNYSLAIRVSSDFIAAIFVGGALGWFLDSMAGTTPFGLVILLLLGFAAGVLNVMRTLGLVAQAPSARARQAGDASARRHDTEENNREGR